MSADSDSRVHREHPYVHEVNDRVAYIAEMMASREWTPDTSKQLRKDLAKAWSCATSTILNYSAEAHRTQLDEVRERRAEVARKAVDALLKIAECDPSLACNGSAKAAACKTLLEFAGLDRPDEDKIQKHAVIGVAEATPEKAREIMKGLFGDVTPDRSPGDLEERSKS